ncbi:MAG: SPOR domain-containing protein [Geobacteraceae bacterium]|nr:SPOR domain-containing protein [Geobacteraceae bacterium]
MENTAKLEGTVQEPPSPAPVTAAQGKETDLTFYYTLPKGEKGVIGSGINTLPPEKAPRQATPVTTPAQKDRPEQQKHVAEKAGITEPAAQKEKTVSTLGAAQPTATAKDPEKTTYTVQFAAYHAKSDAQSLKATLQKNGISARIEEYSVSGKGIWYRVRTGRKLDKNAANKLVAKSGKNAILIAE